MAKGPRKPAKKKLVDPNIRLKALERLRQCTEKCARDYSTNPKEKTKCITGCQRGYQFDIGGYPGQTPVSPANPLTLEDS